MCYDLIKYYFYLLASSAVENPRAAKTKLKYSNSQKKSKLYGSHPSCCMVFVMHLPGG